MLNTFSLLHLQFYFKERKAMFSTTAKHGWRIYYYSWRRQQEQH